MPKPTVRDVAQAAGVHPATVSRALNPGSKNLVNSVTARRVARAAASLGYQPNPIARTLKTARSQTVGVVIPDLTNPLFPPIVRGIQAVLGEHDHSALVVSTDEDADSEETLVPALLARQVDGLIVGTARFDHPILEQLAADDFPIALVNRQAPKLALPSVTSDDSAGMTMLVEHLARLGHRRVLHLAGPQDTSTGVARLQGFQSAIRTSGLVEDPALVTVCDSWTEADGAARFRIALDGTDSFTAVVAATDVIALGCLDVLRERGLSCPLDVSVAGYSDIPFMDKIAPPLTSVSVPKQEIGKESARLLLDRLSQGDGPARSVLLQVELIARDSTAAAPV